MQLLCKSNYTHTHTHTHTHTRPQNYVQPPNHATHLSRHELGKVEKLLLFLPRPLCLLDLWVEPFEPVCGCRQRLIEVNNMTKVMWVMAHTSMENRINLWNNVTQVKRHFHRGPTQKHRSIHCRSLCIIDGMSQEDTRIANERERETDKVDSDLKAVNAPSGFALLCRFSMQQRCDTRPLVLACERRDQTRECVRVVKQCTDESECKHTAARWHAERTSTMHPHPPNHSGQRRLDDMWNATSHDLAHLCGGHVLATCSALLAETARSSFEKCVQPQEQQFAFQVVIELLRQCD